MCRKLIYLTSFVLLLSLVLLSVASAADPNLVGWWKFDGDSNDASGNGRHGTLRGDAHFEAGYIDQALALDGSGDYVNIDGYKGILGAHAFSITAWIKTTDSSGEIVGWGNPARRQRVEFRVNNNRLRCEHGAGNVQGDTNVNDGEWHHVAVTVQENAAIQPPDVLLWLDGRDDTRKPDPDPDVFNLTANRDVKIGLRYTGSGRALEGLVDEVRIYDKALTEAEVRGLAGLAQSFSPEPADGALVEATSVTLQWTSGPYAEQFDVYFGTNPTPGPDELVGRQTETAYVVTDLVEEQTYYWRIDDVEADGTTAHTGDVWSFWVPPQMAYDPEPLDELINVVTETDLSWTGGWSPLMHAVYFGTDADTVSSDAAVPAAILLWDTTFDPGPLAMDTTYYWRVDEFYATHWAKGDVWSFSTVPPIPLADDPNLVVLWTLDEAAGRTAIDWSGHGHHGIFVNDPEWVDGYVGSALHFRGDAEGDSVAHSLAEEASWPAGTVVLWVKADSVGQNQYSSAFSSYRPAQAGFQIDVDGGNPGLYRTNPQTGNHFGPCTTDWVHLALTWDGETTNYYYNGSLAVSGTFTATDTTFNQFAIGRNRNADNILAATIDEFRVYDRVLTRDEIAQVMVGDPLLAWDPQPAIYAQGDAWSITSLAWMPGDGAVEHDVYLGTDPDAVAAADVSDATGIYRGRQAETTYVLPEVLAWGQTHYWRIDEVDPNGTISTGRIWSFTIDDQIVIYDVETPVEYDTTVEPFLAEITLELDPAQNWIAGCGGVSTLVFSYRGQRAPGSVSFDEATGTYTVIGAGSDIWGTSDQFQYAYTTLNMNGSMVVRVDSLTHTHNWTKAGIMIRETLDPGSAFAAVYATGANGVRFQARTIADQDATSDTPVATDEQKALAAPVWLKLERTFPFVSAFYSTDGVSWTPMSWNPQLGPVTPMVYIGLAVTSHSGEDVYAEAVFSNVTADGGVAAEPLTSTEIGMTSNMAEPMYVVLEDATGATAVVYPEGVTTQQADPTDVAIDLSQFVGVDMTAVSKATLGVGDLANPAPGSVGTLTINNVRLMCTLPAEQ